MPKFSIAFITPSTKKPLRHRIVESEDKDSALKKFFAEETADCYSNDEHGFYYFKEDFYDKESESGSIVQCD